MTTPLFTSPVFHVTAGARALGSDADIQDLITRHLCGDWGLCDDHDRRVNDDNLMDGNRVMSVFMLGGVKTYVITERVMDNGVRAGTTVLRWDEY